MTKGKNICASEKLKQRFNPSLCVFQKEEERKPEGSLESKLQRLEKKKKK